MKKLALHDKHVGLGAKIISFAGWAMPLHYTGIIDEHLHTRAEAGLFDVSHMGQIFVEGKKALSDLERLLTCGIEDMPCGKCRYGFMLSDKGGILDDLIVFRISENEFMLVVNAGTREKDLAWVESRVSSDTGVYDRSDEIVKLDIQGPCSEKVMKNVFGEKQGLSCLKRFSMMAFDFQCTEIITGRTGYTGEDGYELFVPASAASRIWDEMIDVPGVKPAGLGARDTLRLEMGYPLYGNDVDEETTPLEAGYERFVDMGKDFIGKGALIKYPRKGPGRVLRGFVTEGRRVARRGFKINTEEGIKGIVTSGAFSPCLKKAIGLCYVENGYDEENREVLIAGPGVEIKAKIIKNLGSLLLPFRSMCLPGGTQKQIDI